MNPTLIYLSKVNIALTLFYIFYRLFFAGDTLWKFRRVYLIFSVLISFAYPLFSIESWLQGKEKVQEIVMTYAQLPEFIVTADNGFSFLSLGFLLSATYLLVVVVLLVRMLLQLISILKIRKPGIFEIVQNTRVMTIDKEIAPFSFFGTIYINPALHNEVETRQILMHELTHVRQWHSMDVVMSELLCIAFWINPASWLLKREIRQNLEFLADNRVINAGFDSKSYQYHLLQLSYQTPDFKLSNKFNVLPLKKRIVMMNQKKSSKSTGLKYLMILPLSFSLVVISNAETLVSKAKYLLQTESSTKVAAADANQKVESFNELAVVGYANQAEPQKKTEPQKLDEVIVVGYGTAEQAKGSAPVIDNSSTAGDGDSPVFVVVEEMPKYPGGNQAMFKYLGENIKYPASAQESSIQGRVICSFVVNVDGSIADTKIVRGIEPDLDAEAIRVINAMPNWEPGMQRGKAVRVKYTLPIIFQLSVNKAQRNEISLSAVMANKPLIVLDGVTQLAEFDLNKINPNTIDNIEVLKDAKATEMYGESGKNGVIKITSKK